MLQERITPAVYLYERLTLNYPKHELQQSTIRTRHFSNKNINIYEDLKWVRRRRCCVRVTAATEKDIFLCKEFEAKVS